MRADELTLKPKMRRGFLQQLFPGRRYPDLTPDERRAYSREWARQNIDRKRSYFAKPSAKVAKRAYAERRKDHIAAYNKQWRIDNKHKLPGYYRRYRLKAEYGLTPEQYAEMVSAQSGKCALCLSERIGRAKETKLHVDHCHKSGRVRALLCHHCNMVLGHCMDDPALLRRAADYVERYANQ